MTSFMRYAFSYFHQKSQENGRNRTSINFIFVGLPSHFSLGKHDVIDNFQVDSIILINPAPQIERKNDR